MSAPFDTGLEEIAARAVVFAGDGEMADLMRRHDWAATPFGPVADWPSCLRIAVQLILGSRYPMVIWWGRDLLALHNDAYLPVLGDKHPAALGRPGAEVWSEIWEVVGPLAVHVIDHGQAAFFERLLLLMERSGYREETYFTFSYSPIRDDEGRIGGLFCACFDETAAVLGERRMRTLRELATAMTAKSTAEEACEAAARSLAANPLDLPFVLLYLMDAHGHRANLAGAAGLAPGDPGGPATISMGEVGAGVWPLATVFEREEAVALDPLPDGMPPLPGGPWERAESAIVLPLPAAGHERPGGFIVAGISPHRALDEQYRGFIDLVAGSVATGIASARAIEAERRRAEKLAELDRAKTAFFSNVSHEFRTPLTLMLGPLEDLLARPDDRLAPEERADVAVVHRNGLRLLRLVNTLLDFSRIEAGRVEACFEPSDLAAVTGDLTGVFRSMVERAGLRLRVETPPLPAPVYVDREMWEKIVLNLISNAFKFTFTGGIEVSLRVEDDGGWAMLRVRDTGVGIPAAELPNVFERFHRVRAARARTHEGTGIGLTLVRELVELHGGTIAIESELDRGTLVSVAIPLGTDHLPADRIGAAPTLASTALGAAPFVEEARLWRQDDDGETPADVPFGRSGGVAETTAGRVLVVDDNADMRDYLRRLLAPFWRVETAADGDEALAAIRRERPDLVLADVMMPGLDGIGLLRALRNDSATHDLPVVLLSARAGEEAAVEGLAAGADDYLAEPFSARELVARVGVNLAMARSRLESAGRERLHAERLRGLARASLAINASLSAEETTRLVAEQARELIGAHQSLFYLAPGRDSGRTLGAVSLSVAYDDWRGRAEPPSWVGGAALLRRHSRPLRLARAELDAHPIGRLLAVDGDKRPPPRGWLAAPLVGRDGRNVGLLGVTDRFAGEFTEEDEAILVQLAQMAVIAVENARLYERSEAAIRGRDEFLAGISHDLRSPLTTIKGRAQMLRRRAGRHGPEIVADFDEGLRAIDETTARLTALIADLTDSARGAETSAANPAHEVEDPIDLVMLLHDEVRHHQGTTTRHQIVVQAEPHRLIGAWDPTDLSRVFSNLLENAIKYSPDGGEIRVRVAEDANAATRTAVVTIADHGLGIPAADVPTVFERFRRGSNVAGRIAGTGIGLAGVRELVGRYGGRVSVESREGDGSTFTVRLPVLDAVRG